MDVDRRAELWFAGGGEQPETRVDLSAVLSEGRYLWVAGDEAASIELLTADDEVCPTGYDDQVTMRLADLVGLPSGGAEEVDIEGLARAGRHLWVVGSHSLVRTKVKPEEADPDGIRRLADVEDQRNRRILARLLVEQGEDGRPRLIRKAADGARSAVLGRKGRTLTGVLAEDPHLGPFLALPGKDNGFDVEGLAVHDDTVYLGLRGPVLRGWAVVLEIRPYAKEGSARLRLGPVNADGDRYFKHFLDLDGLGVRDLCPFGDDLLVLAGPTMDLDGPVRVYRWRGACTLQTAEVVRGAEITCLFEVPHGVGADHAEGITIIGGADDPRLLVVYDSPAPERVRPGGSVLADVLPLH